jgi:hypothetical protein
LTPRPTRFPFASASVLAAALVTAAPGTSSAQEAAAEKGVLGVGLIVGEPTGVSGKYYLADDRAIDLAIGGAIVGRGIQVHGDYLWHPWILEQKESFALPVYLGVGARILNHDGGGSDEDHVRLGVRGPVGILFDFTRLPLDVFAEVAGVIDYRTRGDHFGLGINAGIGARYYF